MVFPGDSHGGKCHIGKVSNVGPEEFAQTQELTDLVPSGRCRGLLESLKLIRFSWMPFSIRRYPRKLTLCLLKFNLGKFNLSLCWVRRWRSCSR